jgi:metal-responsive CopG/Arc/MetJ family transcriptional regulator
MAKVNISISQEILEEIDKLRQEENTTRSELLRRAFETYVEILEEKRKEIKKRKGIERAIELQDEIRDSIGDKDLIEDLRKWREKRR